MARLFGTDGVRGVANAELTPELAFRLGYAAARRIADESAATPSILIGTDTRRSRHMLEAALVAGITSAGCNAYTAGVIPTPGVAYLVRKYSMDAGVVISASHNPFLDNGIKFFDRHGYKMSDAVEETLERDLRAMGAGSGNGITAPRPVGGKIGIRVEAEDALDDYMSYVKSTLNGKDFTGIPVVLDCANGAAFRVGPALFYELNAEISVIGNDPDGENINLRCGSTHMEALAQCVLENGSAVGLAFDGDGDRCLAVDENGRVVDGDQIMAILAHFYKSRGLLTNDTLVATAMSNMGLSLMCRQDGITLEKTTVGDKYVLERMLEIGCVLGGEQSGHIINLNHGTTGDGLLTATQLVMVMRETGQPLSRLASVMEKFPQVLRNARISNERKNDYLTSTEIANAIQDLNQQFQGHGVVLIRPSGTEPLIRVMIEGRDLEEITKAADALVALIEDVLI